MGLKDEIIEQKRKAKEQAELEAENAARERAQKFIELKENYEKGVVPQEWIDLYDKYALKIREWFSESSKDFSCREPVSEEYYRSKEDFGDDEVDELTLMNEYLTKRLQSDGFEDAIFELVEETETYTTAEDWARYRSESEEDKRRIMDNYRETLWNEISKDAGGDVNNVAAPRLSTVSLQSTGTRQVYYIVVECYLEEGNGEHRAINKARISRSLNNTQPTKSVHLWRKKQVLTCGGVCAGIGLAVAIILVFTTSVLELFIPVFAAMGFIYGSLIGLSIRYIKLALFARNNSAYRMRRKYIILPILCIIVLIAAIIGGVIGILKLI